ncbi:hypothetical protein PENSPDRAFT_222782 [Peniophora sp. CONT]|nr:hypothetical protein PENSPDRAFT_222782 [Peniophora sp. CONT]
MYTIGPMMILSAYLFEKTHNVTYQSVAQLSLDFIINHLWNGTIVLDGIYLDSCAAFDNAPSSVNQAWFVEGLAVWANVTQNDTLTAILNMALPTITTFPMWTTPDGVVNDQNEEFYQAVKGIYIRGLAEARMRNPGTDLARYIEAYINVQFNAVLDLSRAAAPNDNYYSRSWIGPPATSFDAYANIGALDLLNAAFSLVEPSTSVLRVFIFITTARLIQAQTFRQQLLYHYQ